MTGRFTRDQIARQRPGPALPAPEIARSRPLTDPGPEDATMRRREAELDRLIGRYPREARWMPAGREAGH